LLAELRGWGFWLRF